MAYTFLNAVNESLKRVKVIAGDAGELTTFTDSQRQHEIDVIIQIWNEAVRNLYALGALQGEVAEGSVTLVSSPATKEYAVPSDFEAMAGERYTDRVMRDETNGIRIWEYPGGYLRMYAAQPDDTDFTGPPLWWTINPTNNRFSFYNTPTVNENGDVYRFNYEKRIILDDTTDSFPFSDSVVDSLLPTVAEIYRLDAQGGARDPISAFAGFRTAVALVTQTKPRKSYGTERLKGRRTA